MTPADLAELIPVADKGDTIADLFSSAQAAYRTGDAETAIEGVAATLVALCELRAKALAAFLPPPEEDWTRMVTIDVPDSFTFGQPAPVCATGRYGRWRESFDLILRLNPHVPLRMQFARRQNPFLRRDFLNNCGARVSIRGRFFEPTDEGQETTLAEERLQIEVRGDTKAATACLKRLHLEALERFAGGAAGITRSAN